MFFDRSPDPDPEPDPERFQALMVDDQPDFEDLVVCVFGITEPVAETYRCLLERPESTVKDLAQVMNCDRSNVNRRLDVLREKELATRKRRILTGGGQTYEYTPTPLDQAQDLMHRTLDEWSATMHDQINALPSKLE